MNLSELVIVQTNDLPIKHKGNVHDGKVRSVYWLGENENENLEKQSIGRPNSEKGIMVISDRISAFDYNWQTESGLSGVPGKGASLNAISKYWFDRFETEGLARNHVLATPHPLVWIVEKAQPIKIEAIARQFITGSMWRAYAKGKRTFCGIELPEGLIENQSTGGLLITPSTKGILRGIPGVEESEDINITRQQILDNYESFGFKQKLDVPKYESLLISGFKLIGNELSQRNIIFVDTKFEFGYVTGEDGASEVIYIDEIGTPDSSRYWSFRPYMKGEAVEESKEVFRKALLDSVPDSDVLTNKDRMDERKELAREFKFPDSVFVNTGNLYQRLAQTITSKPVPTIENAREEIIESLIPYGLIE